MGKLKGAVVPYDVTGSPVIPPVRFRHLESQPGGNRIGEAVIIQKFIGYYLPSDYEVCLVNYALIKKYSGHGAGTGVA